MREERQFGFADCEQSMVHKRTRQEKFLAEMEEVVPWSLLLKGISKNRFFFVRTVLLTSVISCSRWCLHGNRPSRSGGCLIFRGALNLLEPYYHKTGSQVGRPPYPLETMLRIHLMQNWYSLSDSAMEDALIEVYSMRCFARINLCRDKIPDETTILAFQHILEKKNLAEKIFETLKEHLSFQSIKVSQGTIIDATIINAPSSTKNKNHQRDPEMH